jgi:rfaE bifunctional protein kinase chain/domain
MSRRCLVLHHQEWDRYRLENVLHAMRGKKVLVLGDVGVDRYTIGSVERISPEAPVPIVAVSEEKLKLGLAANVADNVKTLGGEPFLSGLIGEDRFAADMRGLLRKLKISDRCLVTDGSRKTILKERIVSDGQQLLRVDYENLHAIHSKIEQKVYDLVARLLPKVDALIVEDYAKGLITPSLARKIFALARRLKKPALVDPNSSTPALTYRGASLLTPNKKEAEALAGMKITDEKSLIGAGEKILKQTQSNHVVITRGKDGMAIFSKGERVATLIPTYAQEVYDVSGAGDTVIAVLSLALSAGASIVDACILGNLAAGVEVGKRGTATVTVSEVLAAMESFGAL